MKLRFQLAFAVTLLLAGSSAFSAERAVLRNGFTIEAQRHEVLGSVTRLYTGADEHAGYIDVASDQIVSFEAEPDPPVPIAAPPVSGVNVNDSVQAASSQTGIDPELINSVIKAESGFNPHAISPKGAQGLMQLMPETAKKLGVKDSFDPQSNVQAGSQYLRDLLLRYHSDLPLALAAYNAGPQRVQQYHGMPPYTETYQYVSRVIREFNKRKLAQRPQSHSRTPRSHTSPAAADSAPTGESGQ